MARRVDPERARRYRLRTLPRPDQTYVLTAREGEEMARQDEDFYVWRADVERYAKAKGFRLRITTEERPSDSSVILRWSEDR